MRDESSQQKEALAVLRSYLQRSGAVGEAPSTSRVVVYACECGFRSLQPGQCRSHPYPLRAMGPEMRPLEIELALGIPGENQRVEVAHLVAAATKINVPDAQQLLASEGAEVQQIMASALAAAISGEKLCSWAGPR